MEEPAVKQDYNQDWHSIFQYKDGHLYWISPPSPRVSVGEFAGSISGSGYIQIQFKGKFYLRSRIIWVMHHGFLSPHLDVDHIDRNKLNDKITNLRSATKSENMLNRGIMSNNTSGESGIDFVINSNKWRVRHYLNNKQIIIGHYTTLEEAIVAKSNYLATGERQTLLEGVHYNKGASGKNKWRAHITINKRRISLGHYFTEEEARNARQAAEKYYEAILKGII